MPDLSKLLKTGEFSDFTIECRGQTFAVHKNIISTQSHVLHAAVSHAFQEAITGTIDLSEYDVGLIRSLLMFLYTAEYTFTADATGRGEPSFHVRMYSLGDKYDIPPLKAYARSELSSALSPENTLSEDLLDAIPLVYEVLPESDRNLRDIVVSSARACMEGVVKNPSLKTQLAEVLDAVPEFSMDLLTDYATYPSHIICWSCSANQHLPRGPTCSVCRTPVYHSPSIQ